MILPRSIPIADVRYRVRANRKSSASECDFTKRIITVGTKSRQEQDKLNSFVHEILEAIFEERNLRYDRTYPDSEPDDSDSLYIMTHDALNVVVSDLAAVLRNLL